MNKDREKASEALKKIRDRKVINNNPFKNTINKNSGMNNTKGFSNNKRSRSFKCN